MYKNAYESLQGWEGDQGTVREKTGEGRAVCGRDNKEGSFHQETFVIISPLGGGWSGVTHNEAPSVPTLLVLHRKASSANHACSSLMSLNVSCVRRNSIAQISEKETTVTDRNKK